MNNKLDSKMQRAQNSTDCCKSGTNRTGADRYSHKSGSNRSTKPNTNAKNTQNKSGENCR